MKKAIPAAVISLIFIECVSYALNVDSHFDWPGFGMTQFICAIFSFFLGLILLVIRPTNEIGKGLLLGTGVVLLIGWAVCSNSSISFR